MLEKEKLYGLGICGKEVLGIDAGVDMSLVCHVLRDLSVKMRCFVFENHIGQTLTNKLTGFRLD